MNNDNNDTHYDCELELGISKEIYITLAHKQSNWKNITVVGDTP